MPGAGEMGSKAYKARLAKSAGLVCSKPFESDFGKKVLMKYGWKPGEGLGAHGQGKVENIQASRMDKGSGLGHEKRKDDGQWDNWWADCFNNVAKKVKVAHPASKGANMDSSDSSSEEEAAPRMVAKKANVMGGKLRRVLRQEATAK